MDSSFDLFAESLLSHSQLNSLIKYCESTFVPPCKDGFERPMGPSDFSSYLCYCNENFLTILNLLEVNISESPIQDLNYYKKIKRKFIVNIIILCGQHSSNNYWTSEFSIDLSRRILLKVLEILGASSLDIVLCNDNQFILKQILTTLRPFLLKETWNDNPAMTLCYSWLIKHVKNPYLGENLASILPTALIIVDDIAMDNILCGLECLRHIIKYSDNTDLCLYGQDQVILKTLELLLHRKEGNLVSALVNVIVEFQEKKKMYQDPLLINVERNEFDPFIDMFLGKMYLEQSLERREAYGKGLPKLIIARNLGILHHSSLLLNIIEQYALEPTSSLNGLEALDAFLKNCWPRVGHHRNKLLAIIFKAYYSTVRGHLNLVKEEEFKTKCRDIFETLEMASPNILEPELDKLPQIPTVAGLLKNVGILEFVNDDIKIIRKDV